MRPFDFLADTPPRKLPCRLNLCVCIIPSAISKAMDANTGSVE